MTKKLLSALLAILLVCSLLPFTAFADVVYFKPDGEISVPGILEEVIDAEVTPSKNGVELNVTLENGITKEQWAYLYQYYRNNAGTKLLLDYETDVPEGTADCIFCSPSNGYTFGDFQNNYKRIEDYKDGIEGFNCFSLDGDRHMGSRLFIAECSLDSGNVTITPREDSYEEYYAWLNESGNVISYTVVKYIIIRKCDNSFKYSESELEDMAPSENRIRLANDEFFKHWNEEEELLKSFEHEENPGNMYIDISFGGSSELPKGIECDFVDGILEIKIGKLEPEDLAKAYDVFSAAQGQLYLDISVKLPEGTTKFTERRGNGPYFRMVKGEIGAAGIEDFNTYNSENNYPYFKYNIGRLVKDGDQVLFFPESNSGLDFEFIGYRLGSEENAGTNYAALVMNVYSTPEARIVSFKDPIAPMPVDASQIEVDKNYETILSGKKDGGEPNYDPETGTLTYVYQGKGTTEGEIISSFSGISENAETSTTIKAPDGYTLFKFYDANGEEMNFDEDHPESVSVSCPFVRKSNLYNRNIRYTFLWKKPADGSLLYQEIYVTNDFKNGLTYFDIYWEVPKEEQVKIYSEKQQGFVTPEDLAESGIIVNIDWKSGYVHTSFEGENPDLNKFGECVAFILPPEKATYFKAVNGGGNTEFPPRYDKDSADERKNFFVNAAELEEIEEDLDDPYDWLPNLPVLIYDSASVGDITYYYSSFISTEHLIVEWYGGEEESAELIETKDGKRGYFLYLKMDDLSFVTTTTGIEENEINENVKYPTVVKSNGSNEKWFLKTKIAPQNSESQAKLLDLKAQFETAPEGMTRIFIPYSAIDFKGDIESNNFQFTITHYDGCENLAALEDYLKDNKEGFPVACEYDEYGIYFYTDSFSPFVFEFEDLGLKNPERPEKHRHSSDTVVIGAKDTDEKKAEEENPDTGAPVLSMSTGIVLAGIALVLAKRK